MQAPAPYLPPPPTPQSNAPSQHSTQQHSHGAQQQQQQFTGYPQHPQQSAYPIAPPRKRTMQNMFGAVPVDLEIKMQKQIEEQKHAPVSMGQRAGQLAMGAGMGFFMGATVTVVSVSFCALLLLTALHLAKLPCRLMR